MFLRIKKYTPLFPTTQVACATLLYFNWLGQTMERFSEYPVLRRLILVGCLLLLSLMRYYPNFATKRLPPVQAEKQFLSTGRAYLESIVMVALGLFLNWISINPFAKYAVFLASLPAIHSLLTIRVRADAPTVLNYPDLDRPLDPDE